MKIVLITGASGLIGEGVTKLLIDKNYEVRHLGRVKRNIENVKSFVWDIEKREIEKGALTGCNYIIHLAGEGIADGKWTKERKKKITDSRVISAKLLFDKVKEEASPLIAFISASGINYYGAVTSEKIFFEDDPPAKTFIGECCRLWEKEADLFTSISRVVKYRTAVVLSKKGGALKKIAAPINLGLGSTLGSGLQYVPWIHIEDICKLYLFALENTELSGVYNAVADEANTNKSLTKVIAKVLHRPLFLPNIPSFLLKIIFGEMSCLVLEGSRASNRKIKDAGFVFKYNKLDDAVENLYSK
jgi:uncharacterized protein